MSRKDKTAPGSSIVNVLVPMYKRDWEEFREIVYADAPGLHPRDAVYSLIRAVVNGDIRMEPRKPGMGS